MAPDPAPQSFRCPGRSGPDWLVTEESPDILRQLEGAAVTLAGLLAKAFEADGIQIAWHVWLQTRHGHRIVVEGLQEGIQRRLAHEGRSACEQLIEDRSQSID